jgi:hypothetical protein
LLNYPTHLNNICINTSLLSSSFQLLAIQLATAKSSKNSTQTKGILHNYHGTMRLSTISVLALSITATPTPEVQTLSIAELTTMANTWNSVDVSSSDRDTSYDAENALDKHLPRKFLLRRWIESRILEDQTGMAK